MRRLWIVAALAALGLAGGAAAQETAPDIVATIEAGRATEAPAATEVVAGGFAFEVPADSPLVACVVAVDESLAGRQSVTVQLLARQADGVRALPAYDAPPVGVMALAIVGDCLELEGPRS